MRSASFDVLIVGSGPAGVSAAFPLVRAGLKVLMVDGGREASVMPPSRPFLTERLESSEQWQWMIGKDFHALKNTGTVSPKFRVPTHDYVFADFEKENHIESENFVVAGSLARGGLSNAWGCGVARLSAHELTDYPFPAADMDQSYEAVSRRIGISGSSRDDLSDYFGLDEWAQPPIQIDALHSRILDFYLSRRSRILPHGFRLGRSRVAALSQDHGERRACDVSGNCLWGCHRRALYCSADEIPALLKYENFNFRSGFVVKRIIKAEASTGIVCKGEYCHQEQTVTAQRVILAAGTLATTRLALHALKLQSPVRIQSCPTAAFLLWLPRMLGAPRTNAFGLGQLSYTLDMSNGMCAFGSTFSTTGIPVVEFVRHLPVRKRFGIDLLRQLLSSCLVGNMFLPGCLSTTKASLAANGALKIEGGYSDSVPVLMAEAAKRLRKSYSHLGALLLPKSFTVGQPGGDVHYTSTLPMRTNPVLGQTNALGELAGLNGVHVVDGACLPTVSGKSHTLTLMANADRIARAMAE